MSQFSPPLSHSQVAGIASCAQEAVELYTPGGVPISDFDDLWSGSLVLFQAKSGCVFAQSAQPTSSCPPFAPILPTAPWAATRQWAASPVSSGEFFEDESGACASVADLALLAEQSSAMEAATPPRARASGWSGKSPAREESCVLERNNRHLKFMERNNAVGLADSECSLKQSRLSSVQQLMPSQQTFLQQATQEQLLPTDASTFGADSSSSSSVPLEIYVKTLSGRRLKVTLHASARVGDVKSSVAEQEGLPIENIELVCRGRVLHSNGHAIRDYGINQGALVFMIPAAL